MQKELKRDFYDTMISNLWSLLEKPEDKMPVYGYGSEEIKKRFNALKMSLVNHEQTVKQNQDLQTELRNLNKKPFFPYPLNSGNMADYGAFYLVSHAWFSFLNTPQQIGVIEVQYKTDNRRVIYIGISQGDPTPEGFNKSVLNIAKYGQKMKDSLDVV